MPFQQVQLLGTKEQIEIHLNAPPDRPTRIFVDDGSGYDRLSAKAIEFPVSD
jgi:hypothetical protein